MVAGTLDFNGNNPGNTNILNLLNVSSYTQMVIKGLFLIFAVVLAEIRKTVIAPK